MKDIIEHLERIGFSTREAAVYVAIVSGNQGIASIAESSGVSRASVYRAVEDLLERGLIREEEQNGERMYLPESPELMVQILQKERKAIEEKIGLAEVLTEKLLGLYLANKSAPTVRYIKGARALRLLQKEISQYEQDILQISGYDAFRALYKKEDSKKHETDLKSKKISIRSILVTDEKLDFDPDFSIEVIQLSPKIFDIKGEIAVCGDYTALFSYTNDIVAVLIHSPIIAKTTRETLELAWAKAKELEAGK